MRKICTILGLAAILLLLSSCDKEAVVFPESGGERVLFNIPDQWEWALEVVPTYDNLLLCAEVRMTEEEYWDTYISAYNLDTGDIVRLVGGDDGYSCATVSPNGERMIYNHGWGRVYLTSFPPGGEPIRLNAPGINGAGWVDNEYCLYVPFGAQGSELRLLNVDTMEWRTILKTEEGGGYAVYISPDGTKWVLTRNYVEDFGRYFWADLYTWDGENLTFEKPLFDYTDGFLYAGGWSPDGTKLLARGYRDPDNPVTTDSALFVYDMRTDVFTQLTFTDYRWEGGVQYCCWSADGNTVYFSTRERTFALDARKIYH